MRAALVAGALLLANSAAAQEKPEWAGVWEGRVGTYPVRLCIDADGGPARGAYYYLSSLEPIAITEEDGEGGWIEKSPDGGPSALWEFREQTGKELRGTWRQGQRRLPFDLAPLAWIAGEYSGPCSSDAFLTPRIAGGDVLGTPAELDGWRYTAQSYQPPAHFSEELGLESFTFSPERPGDARILAELEKGLPTGSYDATYLQCMGDNIAFHGTDGDYRTSSKPVFVSADWLTTLESYDMYCGGAHPSHGFYHRTFDRRSGEEVELASWFTEAGAEYQPGEGGEGYFNILPPLIDLIVANGPSDGEPTDGPAERDFFVKECREVLNTWSWRFGLSRAGLLAVPVVPHAYAPCSATFTVPWNELDPFLNAEGKARVARLLAAR